MMGLGLTIVSKSRPRAEPLQTLGNLRQEQSGGSLCVECRVSEDISRPGCFLWLQWWRSPQQLEEHLGSVHFHTLLGAIKVLGVLESARVVELQDATSVMGALLTDRVDVNAVPQKG